MTFTRTTGNTQATGGIDTLIDDDNSPDVTHYNFKFTPEVFYPGDKFKYMVEEWYDDISEYRAYEVKEVVYSDIKPDPIEYAQPQDYTKNLVARLKLDGDLLDDSGNGNDGTINYSSNFLYWYTLEDVLTDIVSGNDLSLTTGTQTFVDTPFGRGLSLDGSTHFSSGSNAGFSGDDEGTLECWFKMDNNNSECIVSAGASTPALTGFALFVNANGNGSVSLEFGGGNGYRSATGVVGTGEWHHFVATKTAGAINTTSKLYIDGVEISSSTASTNTPNITNSPVRIGRFGTGVSNDFTGDIAHAKVYDVALSDTQVKELYRKNTETNFDNGIGQEAFHGIGYEYVTLANESNFDFERTDKFSFTFWFRGEKSGELDSIINKNITSTTAGYSIYLRDGGVSDDALEVTIRNSSGNRIIARADDIVIRDGQWHFMTVTYDGSSDVTGVKVYLDTVSQTVDNISNTLTASILNNNAFDIGQPANGVVTRHIWGQIQDVRVYDVDLDSNKISQIYNATKAYYDPILWLKFEDDATDSSDEGNDGTWTGTELYDLGQVGEKSARYEGSSYIAFPNKSKYRFHKFQPFSVGLWTKINSDITDTDTIFGKVDDNTSSSGLGYGVTYDTVNNRLRFNLITGGTAYQTFSTNSSISEDVWYYLIFTYDGSGNRSGMKIYIDGLLDATGTSSSITNEFLNVFDFTIGAESDGGGDFDGLTDELKVWNYELTAEEALKEAGRKNGSIYLPITQGIKYRVKLQDLSPTPRKYYWERHEIQ